MRGYVGNKARVVVVWGAVFALGALLGAPSAHAIVPTLTLTNTGGDLVQVSVTGDANVGVILYYNVGSAGGTLSTTLGTTNSSGGFSSVVNGASYAIQAGGSVYVMVNGQQSATQAWPSGNSGSTGTASGNPTFSQSTVTASIGQTTTVTSQGSGTGVYLVSNSAPTVANVSVSGTQVAVTGQQLGGATLKICYVGSATACTNLAVSVIAAAVSTSTLAVSPATLNLVPGQVASVTVTGGSGYSISGATSTSVASQSLDGSALTINALAPGTAAVVVCSSANGCGTVNVTVAAAAPATVRIKFDSQNPPVNVGQRATVMLSGGTGRYVVGNNPSPNLVEAIMSDRTLTLKGIAPGSAFVTACDATNSNNCDTVFFNVTNSGTAPVMPVAATTTAPVVPAPAAQIPAAPAPAPSVAPAPIAGTAAVSDALAAVLAMQKQLAQMLTEIQSMQSKLLQIAASLAANAPTRGASVAVSPVATLFFSDLAVGSSGDEVTALQNRLTAGGYYSGPVTGFYGSLTKAAVFRYQTARGVPSTGEIDAATRAALNTGN